MASTAEIRVVNLAGLVQGITLVTFPAARTIFTDPAEYDLTSTQYGAMFLPQVVTAIAASLLGASVARRFSSRKVLLLGLGANITAMVVLVVTSVVKTDPAASPMLLLATAFLGAGFGLTVPVLTTFVLTAALPDDVPWLAVAVFGLAGLGCSALLPLTISLGQGSLTGMSSALAGAVIACYQVGYGVAAFGVGPLVDAGADLSALYGWTAAAAAAMALLAFTIARGLPSTESAARPATGLGPHASATAPS